MPARQAGLEPATHSLEDYRRCHTALPRKTETHGFTTFPSPSVTTHLPAARGNCKTICANLPARASDHGGRTDHGGATITRRMPLRTDGSDSACGSSGKKASPAPLCSRAMRRVGRPRPPAPLPLRACPAAAAVTIRSMAATALNPEFPAALLDLSGPMSKDLQKFEGVPSAWSTPRFVFPSSQITRAFASFAL